LGLVCFLVVVFAAAALGSVATSSSVRDWYVALEKPSWNPPAWLFGPVWTTLYVMMAVAAWSVWRERGWRGARGALALFGVQLGLNSLWSVLFFGLRAPGLALVEILLMWGAILATLVAFWRVRPLAGALLVPYLAWVSFAAVLNAVLWRLNA
jgi:translocator protein